MSNLKNRVSQRLDISKTPLWLLLELLSSLGLQFRSQGTGIDGLRGWGEPAVFCSCCQVCWTETVGFMLFGHGLPEAVKGAQVSKLVAVLQVYC